MKHTINKTGFDLYFSHEFKGRGGWHILTEATTGRDKKTFKQYTTDSQFIDKLSDMKSDAATFEEIQKAYFERFFDERTSQDIEEFFEELQNEKETE